MEQTETKTSGIKAFYEKSYKKLLMVPFGLLIIAILLIGAQIASTGDFINRDVSLKGGVTMTIPTEVVVDTDALEAALNAQFPASDINTKSLNQLGRQIAVIVEADLTQDEVPALREAIGTVLNRELVSEEVTVEIVGSSLGASFFKEIIIALLIAFVFMAIVVFLYFRTFIPSLAVILAALSDIIITLAIVNLMGMRLSSAGIAAFLMLIGYSVDTDILLSSRVLKNKEGTVMERVYGAMKTGLTMSITTLIALSIALIFTDSEVITQIMTILLVGLLVDLVMTWLQNVGILRWYLDKKYSP